MTDAVAIVAQSGLDAKREAALAILSTNWVGHPDYQFRARHSTNPNIYVPARSLYLFGIAQLAANARDANPAFHRANQVRKALAGV